MRAERTAGILLPVFSLPGPEGIGDFGPPAYRFVDQLRKAGQKYWQVLPLTIVDTTGSPYASPSAMAGNVLLVSGALLKRDGFLPPAYRLPSLPGRRVRYRAVSAAKWKIVRDAFRFFRDGAPPKMQREFDAFIRREGWWLDEYVLYQAIKDAHGQRPWWTWGKAWRSPAAARRSITPRLAKRMLLHAFAQWLFDRQWRALRRYARRCGVKFVGDMPFYVQLDSVQAWRYPELFEIDRRGRPKVVAGVPPDLYSRTGQKWGNPVYRWAAHRRTKFAWWVRRLGGMFDRFDVVRFDHFRGLNATFHIPATAKDGRRGRWVPTPGRELLAALRRRWPHLPLVAEDLGLKEPNAEHLRRPFRLPAVRTLAFAWSGLPRNIHHPEFVIADSWYYTSTHDTNTVSGWYRDSAKWYERAHFRAWTKRTKGMVSWRAIETVLESRAWVAMVAAQDLLGLGSDARINRPATKRGNWSWRMPRSGLPAAVVRQWGRLTASSGRSA